MRGCRLAFRHVVVCVVVLLCEVGVETNPQPAARRPKLRHQSGHSSAALLNVRQVKTEQTEVAATREKTGTACEGSSLTIKCPAGHVIQVQRANYGRTSYDLCNEARVSKGWSIDCSSSRAIDVVSRRCDRRQKCEIEATNRRFGDPCQLTRKYLSVGYRCRPIRKAPTTMTPTEHTTIEELPIDPVTEKPEEPTEESKLSSERTRGSSKPTKSPTPTTKKATSPTLLPGDRMKYCPETKARGITWPKSAPGITRQSRCANNQEGYALWRCGTGPTQWVGKPDLTACVSPEIKRIKDKLADGRERVEDIAEEMANVTKVEKLEGDDILVTARLMEDIMISMQKQNEYDDKPMRTRTLHRVSEAMVKTGSNMLDKDKISSWRALPQEEQAKVATSLVNTVEFSAFKLADDIVVPEIITKVDINIVLTVNVISASPPYLPDVVFSPPTIHVRITLPKGTSPTPPPSRNEFSWRSNEMTIPGSVVKDQADPDGLSRLVFITYNNMHELLTPVVYNFHDDDQLQMDTNQLDPPTRRPIYRSHLTPPRDRSYLADDVNRIETIVNTQILSASFSGRKRNIPLVEPLTYTLEHIQTENVSLDGTCAFWNYTEKMYDGHWSDNGCWRESSNKTHTTCQCNHLTNFAVLMDVMGTKLSAEHQLSLMIITHVGCIISIICLFLSFITFLYFKNLQCDRNTIHKNLCLCLFLGEIIFLAGIDKTSNRLACGMVAGVLHYIFLAAFAWMCLEGIQLYVMLIEVFEAEKSRRLYYYLSAYGIPAIIVGISAAVNYKSYGTEVYCWLRADDGFIWAFVGPVLGVITINVIMLSVAIYMMCKHAATMANMKIKEKSRVDNARSWIKGASVLIVLLGLTWSFGLLYLNEHTVTMAYLFTILNSLQGLFIFCFHCLMNEKVQKEYKRCVRHATWLPMCFRVKYGGYKSYPGSMSPQSSTSGNYLQKLLSGRRRKRSSTSSIPTKTSSTTQWHYHNMKSDGTIKSSKSSRSSRLSDPPPEITKVGDEDSLEKKPNRLINANNGHMTITINNSLVDGVNGDLSMIDASVIDSEAVTEFCKGGMGEGAPPVSEDPVKNSDVQPADHHYEELAPTLRAPETGVPAEVLVDSENEPLVKRDSEYLVPQVLEIKPPETEKPVNDYENMKVTDDAVVEIDNNGEMESSMIIDESASTPLLEVPETSQLDEEGATNEEIDLDKYKIDTSKIDTCKSTDSQRTENENTCHSDSDSLVSAEEIELQSNGSTISVHTPLSMSRSSFAMTTPGGDLDDVPDDDNAAERFEQALMSEDDIMVTSGQTSDIEPQANSDIEVLDSSDMNTSSSVC